MVSLGFRSSQSNLYSPGVDDDEQHLEKPRLIVDDILCTSSRRSLKKFADHGC